MNIIAQLLPTLLLTLFFIALALTFLGVGYLLTGKAKLRPGSCGRMPLKPGSKQDCGSSKPSCSLCGDHAKKEDSATEK